MTVPSPLTAVAMAQTAPGSIGNSTMPVAPDQRKALKLPPTMLQPATVVPSPLIPQPSEALSPGSVPSGWMPPEAVQR